LKDAEEEEEEKEVISSDYWDYFDEHEREFSDVRPNKKKIQMNAKMQGTAHTSLPVVGTVVGTGCRYSSRYRCRAHPQGSR